MDQDGRLNWPGSNVLVGSWTGPWPKPGGGWLGVVGIVVAAVLLLVRLALARRRANGRWKRSGRLHDFVGAELAGRSPPDRRLRGMMEVASHDLDAEAGRAHRGGLVGYLSDRPGASRGSTA
jgi:hypothetical protein